MRIEAPALPPTPHGSAPRAHDFPVVYEVFHDPQQPVEILRTIHSFDPCIACAVHLTDEDGDEMLKVKVT